MFAEVHSPVEFTLEGISSLWQRANTRIDFLSSNVFIHVQCPDLVSTDIIFQGISFLVCLSHLATISRPNKFDVNKVRIGM